MCWGRIADRVNSILWRVKIARMRGWEGLEQEQRKNNVSLPDALVNVILALFIYFFLISQGYELWAGSVVME